MGESWVGKFANDDCEVKREGAQGHFLGKYLRRGRLLAFAALVLERQAVDDVEHEGGKLILVFRQVLRDFLDGVAVVVFRAAPERSRSASCR